MFQIGDLVTRKSYNNDIVFKIIDIDGENYILKGDVIRLYADSPKEDLKIYNKEEKDDFIPEIDGFRSLDRDEYFYLPGKIVHIDQDENFLDKCMAFYKKNRIKAYGIYAGNNDLIEIVNESLNKYNPDIIVITGHDAIYRKKRKDGNYKSSNEFISAIKAARQFENSHEKLIIIAGACQSNYEELIKAGANFASSPKRINIHVLDPAIIATCLAFSDKNKNIDLIKILNKTKYGPDGIGGIITKGTMYVGYPR
ncbi:MAG: sporulation peptidase YabG [Bacilli bacterium]